MSSELQSTIETAYAQLAKETGKATPSVAVRSSAVDEDGPLASFAGQHETILNIVGPHALIEAVKQNWESARTEQALAYRQRHGLSVDDIGLAVLVQALVTSDVSGVMFSANPVTGSREEYIVSASWGLGESIVGGTVTPDNWFISAGTLEVLREQLTEKRRMTVAVDGGTREVDVPRMLRSRPSLSHDQVHEVARLGKRLEAEKGWPVDIEFAFSGGQLYLLQCRPITTLESAPAMAGDMSKGDNHESGRG